MSTILFVCTGNTCRSPMAQAIAQHLIREDPPARTLVAASAGVAARQGAPATTEAIEAVTGMGMMFHTHGSTPLSAEAVEGAQIVYGMTAAHVSTARALAPEFAHKVHLLDPAGGDVPDPIGMPQAAYDETAQAIRGMIEARLDEYRAVEGANP